MSKKTRFLLVTTKEKKGKINTSQQTDVETNHQNSHTKPNYFFFFLFFLLGGFFSLVF